MYVLFDVGGTKMRVARSRDCQTFDEIIKIETPSSFEEGIKVLGRVIEDLRDGEKVLWAGGGVAGPLNKDHSELVRSPNLPGWNNKPLKKELERVCQAHVSLQNDSALVGLGEAHYGAGKGHEIIAYVTVSTGVGGVRIVEGKIDKNRFGFEPGHQIIDMGGLACRGCNRGEIHGDGEGHLEAYVSGLAVERRLGKKAYEIRQSDPLWEELAKWLAVGLTNTILHWSPDVVVLGGSMIVGDPIIPLSHIEEHVRQELTIFTHLPILRKAELKDEGGIYGAMKLVEQECTV